VSTEKRNQRLRLFSFVVIGYMMMAFAWWSILLFNKNRDALNAKTELRKMELERDGGYWRTDSKYLEFKSYHERQEWMILGEAIVFVISLILGIYFIDRGHKKEMAAVKERRNFLLSITHELKSPIASIRLALETLIKRELSREQVQKLYTNSLKETERLNELVTDLLLSARLEATYEPNKEPLDLGELLEEVIEKLRVKYPAAIFWFEQENETPYFDGDKLGLTSVAFNLLENAVKYSSPGQVEVKTDLKTEEGQIKIAIADQGIGIPPEEVQNIFRKFYRVGSEETRTTKGTGLGLFIVERIVQAHHGQIQVRPNEPKGTIFEISLPL
jgi:signal transduction histidine kinase